MVVEMGGIIYTRLSAQVYLQRSDFVRLGLSTSCFLGVHLPPHGQRASCKAMCVCVCVCVSSAQSCVLGNNVRGLRWRVRPEGDLRSSRERWW